MRAVPEEKQNDWADYLRGATKELYQAYPLRIGLSGVIEGSLPIGGLSSSAAVIISFMKALCQVNGLHLDDRELITMAKSAENNYVGFPAASWTRAVRSIPRKTISSIWTRWTTAMN